MEENKRGPLGYRNDKGQQVVLHMHPKATKGPKTLKGLLNAVQWTEYDLRPLKINQVENTRKR